MGGGGDTWQYCLLEDVCVCDDQVCYMEEDLVYTSLPHSRYVIACTSMAIHSRSSLATHVHTSLLYTRFNRAVHAQTHLLNRRCLLGVHACLIHMFNYVLVQCA